ncbi:MAG: integrase family protein [Burkholderiales bacterium]|nr:integrase family protein [Burkholderiales bacterium]
MGKLTDARIRAAKTAANDLWLTDDVHVRGAGRLVLRVKSSGSKLFYYRYTGTDGKRAHYAIGPYKSDGDGLASFTLDQARTRCAELVKIRTDHGDVHGYLEAQKREQARQRKVQAEAEARDAFLAQSQSFGRLLEFYIEHLKREGKYSADEVRRALRLHVFDVAEWQQLREKRAADIRPQDIRAMVRRLSDAGIRRQADKIRSYLRAAFSLGAEHADTFCIEQNPVAAIKRVRGANQRGDRVLSADELRAFWQELEGASPMLRDTLRLIIVLGGQRFAQLLRIRTQHVDLDARTVLLFDPKGMRERPREHLLPITETAAGLLARALAINGSAPFVLSTDGRAPIHPSTLSDVVHTVALRMVEKGTARAMFRGGDLRRTCETMQAALAIPKDVRAHLQSHGLGGVQAAHYDRHDYMTEKRAALQAWEGRLLNIVECCCAPKIDQISRVMRAEN